MQQKRTHDRRIHKTKALLRDALSVLIHEKPYDEIVVKEILDRANVARSTFYTHYRDKHELLLSGIHDLLRSARAAEGRSPATPYERMVWFSLPILEHIELHRRSGEATMGAEGRRAMHERLRHAVSELIEDEVRAALRHGVRGSGHASPELIIDWIASTFVLVLNWWVESDSPLSARDADRLFRGLVGPSLAETFS